MILVSATAILLATVGVPGLVAGPTAAEAASFRAAFRDLPATILTGEILRVEVDTPDGSVCDGSIVYRDNTLQKLEQVEEDNDRCRWSAIVPENVRRGEADVYVTVTYKEERTNLHATLDVVRGVDNCGVALREVPGTVKRGSDFVIRIDVPDTLMCGGNITYENGQNQALLLQHESKERCRWELTVPGDVTRGVARVNMTVKNQDGSTSTLWTSFEVAREKDDADLLVAIKDLPATVHRDTALPVRVIVPAGSRCTGGMTFRSAPNVTLDETVEQSGMCRWSIDVPDDAKRGDSELTVKVRSDGKEVELKAVVTIDESINQIEARFKDLAPTIRRGDDLEVRVTVPDGSTCSGEVTFDDGVTRSLTFQRETRDRCLWTIGVPSQTPRGPATVRVQVDDHGQSTNLTSNVRVEGREDEPLNAYWENVPRQAKRGEKFEVAVNVATGSSCVGKINFPEGLRWTLGNRNEDDAYCRWEVEVPVHSKIGTGEVEVKIQRNGKTDTLHSQIQIVDQENKNSSNARTR